MLCYARPKSIHTNIKMTSFPSDIPTGCPLPSAVPCDCAVFRACDSPPPKKSDFRTFHELGRARNARGDNACLRFGLSVFPTKQACEHMLEVFPANGNYVSTGTLAAVHGVIANTPTGNFPAHQTWWPYESVQRETLFV